MTIGNKLAKAKNDSRTVKRMLRHPRRNKSTKKALLRKDGDDYALETAPPEKPLDGGEASINVLAFSGFLVFDRTPLCGEDDNRTKKPTGEQEKWPSPRPLDH